MPRPVLAIVLDLCSSTRGGMSSVGVVAARRGNEFGDEVNSWIWAGDSFRVEGELSLALLSFVFRRASGTGVVVGLGSSDREANWGLLSSSHASKPSMPCSVMGDRAGVGSWSCGTAVTSGPSASSFFILDAASFEDRSPTNHYSARGPWL